MFNRKNVAEVFEKAVSFKDVSEILRKETFVDNRISFCGFICH